MCRLAAYLGPPLPLSRLLTDAPHPLEKQTWAPREMLTGTVNADGVGAGWWLEDEAAVYRSTLPAWADPNLRPLGRTIRGDCLFAAVRGATVAGTTSLADTQPFQSGRLLFMHNGFVTDFEKRFRRPLLDGLSDEAHAAVPGTSDSAHLFALLLDALEGGRVPLDLALERTLSRAAALCRETAAQGLLVLVASDGETVVAGRLSTEGPAPSLHYATGAGWGRGSVLASEPLDPGDHWQPVPEGHLLVLRRDGAPGVRPLSLETASAASIAGAS